MAKAKAEINKSEVIRKFFSEHPAATAKEVVAKLKAQGIEASEGLIYSLKPGKKKKQKGSTKGKAKAAPSSNGALLSVGWRTNHGLGGFGDLHRATLAP